MDTTTLNINSTSGENSDKADKAKQAAAKAAQFAGAASLGIAGTMAVNAINQDNGEKDKIVDTPTVSPVTPHTAIVEEVTAEAVTDFNPNDIMIDTEEVEVMDDNKTEPIEISVETSGEDIAIVEPQPITEENIVTAQADEVLIAQSDPTDEVYIDVQPDMYGGPEGWEEFDHDDILDDLLLADNDDVNDDLDLANDILA